MDPEMVLMAVRQAAFRWFFGLMVTLVVVFNGVF
jgi:hypothetical protein